MRLTTYHLHHAVDSHRSLISRYRKIKWRIVWSEYFLGTSTGSKWICPWIAHLLSALWVTLPEHYPIWRDASVSPEATGVDLLMQFAVTPLRLLSAVYRYNNSVLPAIHWVNSSPVQNTRI